MTVVPNPTDVSTRRVDKDAATEAKSKPPVFIVARGQRDLVRGLEAIFGSSMRIIEDRRWHEAAPPLCSRALAGAERRSVSP